MCIEIVVVAVGWVLNWLKHVSSIKPYVCEVRLEQRIELLVHMQCSRVKLGNGCGLHVQSHFPVPRNHV